jgi:hypothetical protein
MKNLLPASKRVANGIRWMDQNAPKDWRTMINKKTLELGDYSKCIRGQVFGAEASFEMDLKDAKGAEKNGFNAHLPTNCDSTFYRNDKALLTHEWIRQLCL